MHPPIQQTGPEALCFWRFSSSSVACLIMECCLVDHSLPDRAVTGFSSGWVDPSVDWLYISISCRQPTGLLQWQGGHSDTPVTSWWSCLGSAHATYPKKWGHLSWIRWETGGQLVICLTVKLVTCFVYRILRILWRDHVSKAWIRLARDLVTDWVHHPSFCTCMFVCWVEALSDCLAVDF